MPKAQPNPEREPFLTIDMYNDGSRAAVLVIGADDDCIDIKRTLPGDVRVSLTPDDARVMCISVPIPLNSAPYFDDDSVTLRLTVRDCKRTRYEEPIPGLLLHRCAESSEVASVDVLRPARW